MFRGLEVQNPCTDILLFAFLTQFLFVIALIKIYFPKKKLYLSGDFSSEIIKKPLKNCFAMNDDVAIPVEHTDTSAKPNETPTGQVKAKVGKGHRWLLLLPLILTLCLATIIALKADCTIKSGGIVHNCDYNCQPCSDSNSNGELCPDICKDSHYSNYCSSICDTYESHWFVPVVIVFIFLYLLECFLCFEWASHDKRDFNRFREYMADLKLTPPLITSDYQCFHFKKTGRYRSVQIGDSTEREEIEEKVVTSSGSEDFTYSSWEDKTEDIAQISQIEDDWQRIFLCKTIKFQDKETRKAFRDFKRSIEYRYRGRDEYFYMSTKFEIPKYIPRFLVSKETDARVPYCSNGVIFWFWSLLLLTWPYRVYLEIVARLRKVKVIKVIKAT